MTGFARSEGQNETHSWVWELKSVNAKGFDCRCRIPNGFDTLEKQVRTMAGSYFKRGNLSVSLTLERARSGNLYQVNEEALADILEQITALQKALPQASPPTIDGILSLKGVMETAEQQTSEDEHSELEALVVKDLSVAMERLIDMRLAEGARMQGVLQGQIGAIDDLCRQAEKIAALQPDMIKKRLITQVQDLLDQVPALPEERLAQEAAILMIKADVREELDRLIAHIGAARDLMQVNGAIGRQFDFLCQEFNREANTLCSKSSDVDLTRIGLELKAFIEQLREQVQNIE